MALHGGEMAVKSRKWEVKVKVRWRVPRRSYEGPAVTGGVTAMGD